jgi:TonB family protein
MKVKDLSVFLLVAIVLHLMTGYCLGLLLGKWDVDGVVPEFQQGFSSIELNLVSVSKSTPAPVEIAVTEAAPLVKVAEEQAPELPDQVELVDKGVEQDALQATTDVRPRYPLGSRMRGEEGSVTIRVSIDAAGRASGIEIVESSGYPGLDRAGVKALKKAVFRDKGGGLAFSTESTVTFTFDLVD